MTTPTDYRQPLDIANRALQHCGVTRMTSFDQDHKNADAVSFVYDKLRQAELRRNLWRFTIREVALRALDTDTMEVTAPAFDAAKTYTRGSLVTDAGEVYLCSNVPPLASTPAINPAYWTLYVGPLTAQPWDSTLTTGYYAGELVYTPSSTSAVVYMSLVNSNEDTPTSTPVWASGTTYAAGETVTAADALVYQSRVELNVGLNPSAGANPTQWQLVPGTQPQQRMGANWLRVSGATLSKPLIIWPIGYGPFSQRGTRNVFRLPSGYLREAPQEPKPGIGYLGGPVGNGRTDWLVEGNYLLAGEPQGLVLFRFGADVSNVLAMDPMFCEGLSARIALEVCEELTQSTSKLQNIGAQYKTFMTEARLVNGIETGQVAPPEDDFITVRY